VRRYIYFNCENNENNNNFSVLQLS
jgi:hypothetical protein